MKNKNNISNIFGASLDNDMALNNTITVQSKFELCFETHIILNKIMEHLTYCKFIHFNLFIYPHKMKKFMNENALIVKKTIKDKKTNLTTEIEVIESFKVVFCRVYGLSSRQFNAVDFDIKGLIKANKTLMEDRLISFEDQLKKKEIKQKKLKGEINLLSKSHGVYTKNSVTLQSYDNKKTFLFKLNRDIDKKKTSIEQLKKKIKDDKISVCFGDRKVLNKLSSIYNNSNYDQGKYKNSSPSAKKSYQTTYRKLWDESRFNQFFLLGSKDEINGNDSCIISKKSENLYKVKISIPKYVIDELSLTCKFIEIDNVKFKHNEKEILNCLASNSQRKQKAKEYKIKLKNSDPSLIDDNGKIITKSKYLEEYGIAISFRFIKDSFNDPKRESTSWRIMASMDETKQEKAIVSKNNGVIGIDINVEHLAIAEVNSHRCLMKSFNINFDFSDSSKTSNRTLRKESVLKSVKKIIEYAKEKKKPIVIEMLDFKRKKSLIKEENTSFNNNVSKRKNRILSSFAYSMIIDTIKQQAYRNGIAVYEVNPAFTSQIGWLKYSKKYGISRHMAAAYVIARRTYAIEELFEVNEQIILKNEIRTIPLLEDRGNCETYFDYCKKNLRNFLKRQINQNRGSCKKNTQVSSLSVISI
jgi:IS605 OrfB family transposase